jgi:riboflavin kinase/FMN adenylyltransferase
MQVHLGVGVLHAEWPQAVVCVGTFDGVHLGHEAVIRVAVAEAHRQEMPCVLVTFDRHPAAILAPSRNPKCLAPLQENLARFEELGVAVTIVLSFDAELSRMSADRFLQEILIQMAKASQVVVGYDFAMGYGREGTAEWLAARIPTTVIPPFEVEGDRVSSSAIREAVKAGDVGRAARLLGRAYTLTGVIVGGQKLGRQLGYPTANLARSIDQVLPADGIYSGWFESLRGRFRAAVSIGTRPAVGGGARTIEAYLLDYPGESLYGFSARLELIDRLREERTFSSLDALVEQISLDVQEVRGRLPVGKAS